MRHKSGTLLALFSGMMQGHEHNPEWLVIGPERCSDEMRSVAFDQGWPIVESIDHREAMRIVVALSARRVVIETVRSMPSLPMTVVSLASLDTTELVACIAPGLSAETERLAGRLNVHLFDSIPLFSSWSERIGQMDDAETEAVRAGGVPGGDAA